MNECDIVEKFSNFLLFCLDQSGRIKEVKGHSEMIFSGAGHFENLDFFEALSLYDYTSGRQLSSLENLSNGIFCLETSKGVFTAELQKHKGSKGETIFCYLIDSAVKAVTGKCEKGSKKDLLDTLGKISHDFNNLLGVVMGHAELASFLSDNAEARNKHINEVLSASNKIKNLLKQILVFRHHLDEKPVEKVDLRTVINHCVASAKENVESHISIKVKQVEPFFVMQSVSKMIDLLGNLIRNAVEAIDREGEVFIDIEPESSGFHIIRIKDDGIGMSRRTMEQMFEPFFSTHSRMKSAGVGMSIAKGILDDIGGEIQVNSELGNGTEVIVSLPVFLDTEKKGTVLLVDDEESILEVTGDIVESLGYRVVKCTDLDGSQQALSNELFDIMLVDHHLAEGTGLDLIEYARNKGIKTPAVLSCGHHCESDFSENQIDGFLMKPSSISDIKNMFNSLLAK